MASANEIQFEKYWREKISQEVGAYLLQDNEPLSEDQHEAILHIRSYIEGAK